jgi:hypothetical protein
LRRHHELQFSGIADDIFSRIRQKVDSAIGEKVPEAVQKLSAVYENLQSENPEDWSNAVHSCRRILQDLADSIYPPRADLVKDVKGKQRVIKLGPDKRNRSFLRLAEPAPELFAKANIVPQLAFEKCGSVQFAPTVITLMGLLAGTEILLSLSCPSH